LLKLIFPRKIKQSNYHKFVKQINTHILSVYLFFYGKNTLFVVNFVLKYDYVNTYIYRVVNFSRKENGKNIIYISYVVYILLILFIIFIFFFMENIHTLL